ncbi:MAG: hypothetical protein ACK5T6_15515 [Pirellula sp.]
MAEKSNAERYAPSFFCVRSFCPLRFLFCMDNQWNELVARLGEEKERKRGDAENAEFVQLAAGCLLCHPFVETCSAETR